MGYKDITVGEKLAKAKAARFVKSKSGTIGLEIAFEFEETTTNNREVINWTAWLSPKAIDRSMETLTSVLGYNGSETADPLGNLTDPNALNYTQEVKLVIEMQPSEDGTKEYPRVKYVNRVGGSGFATVAPETIKADLMSVGFKAAYLAAKQKLGQTTTPTPTMNTEEKLPF